MSPETSNPMGGTILGTVQIGLPYGRLADQAVMSEERAFRILDAAWARGIRAFDTAQAYGESARRLASWLMQRRRIRDAHVCTKIAHDASRPLAERAREAVGLFAGAASVLLMSHHALEGSAWTEFSACAAALGAQAGMSVYDAVEVRAAAGLPRLHRLQVPGNVLDDRALAARDGADLPLDFRSVYLQGVLLDSPDVAERRVPGAGPVVSELRLIAAEMGVALAPALLAGFRSRIRDADRLVIGADSSEQLDVLDAAAALSPATVSAFVRSVAARRAALVTDRLLDPRRWS